MLYFPQIPFLISLRRNHLTIEHDTRNRVKSKVSGFASSRDPSFLSLHHFVNPATFLCPRSQSSSSKCLQGSETTGVRDEKDQHPSFIWAMWTECGTRVLCVDFEVWTFPIPNPRWTAKKKLSDIKFIYLNFGESTRRLSNTNKLWIFIFIGEFTSTKNPMWH